MRHELLVMPELGWHDILQGSHSCFGRAIDMPTPERSDPQAAIFCLGH